MKYEPTIQIWKPIVAEQLENKIKKMQVGQWVECHHNKKHPSRFVGFLGSVIWLVHWQGDATTTNKKFKKAVAASKNRREYYARIHNSV
jgi:hypothetical protein|tara:strand:- start:597 stop:863 length:267 start_codon:yes stop_codon:yes gene_type:complete